MDVTLWLLGVVSSNFTQFQIGNSVFTSGFHIRFLVSHPVFIWFSGFQSGFGSLLKKWILFEGRYLDDQWSDCTQIFFTSSSWIALSIEPVSRVPAPLAQKLQARHIFLEYFFNDFKEYSIHLTWDSELLSIQFGLEHSQKMIAKKEHFFARLRRIVFPVAFIHCNIQILWHFLRAFGAD